MFKIAKMHTGKQRPMEYYEAGEAVVLGEALVLANGKLVKATNAVEFIALADGANKVIPVVRVMEEDEFQTEFNADAAAINVGDKVTLADDALKVTTTTANGIFTVVEKLDDTKVVGMFRR